jgi:N-acetyl-gamma-glutamyl-phosphate/LysW-gamma-L-alpha-aminoadipyl-6-phosphate reductase
VTATATPARVGIVGGSGYGGAECMLWILGHPRLEVVAATSRRHAGRPVSDVHGNLLGFTDLAFTDASAVDLAEDVDALIFALPHGEALARIPEVVERRPDLRIVDLSGDFRLRDPAAYEAAYGRPHPAPEIAATFAYGLTETNRDAIRHATRVANPGCFATGSAFALAPLALAGLLVEDAFVAAATGSSGSGAEAKATTHHPERAQDYRAYRVLRHQHAPEIEQHLADLGGPVRVELVPHSAPLARGIFTTARVRLPEGAPDAREVFANLAEAEPFVRLRTDTPRLAAVARTNLVDVAVHADGRTLVVLTAIDNLGKGMAGQAIQNLNLLLGYPETEGLLRPGGRP